MGDYCITIPGIGYAECAKIVKALSDAGITCPIYTNIPDETDLIARQVIRGVWGAGEDRKKNLTKYGYDYEAIQSRVNEMYEKGVAGNA